MQSARRQAGYALSDLVLAVALATVIGAIAAPLASALLNHHRLATTSRSLAFEIARARMQAVGQNVFVRIALVGNGQYMRQRSTDGVTYEADGAPVSLPSGFSVAAGSSGLPRFDRQGMAPASTTLVISGPSGERTVRTSILGRVTNS
jgi:Tfp pilus assembly protein FimT